MNNSTKAIFALGIIVFVIVCFQKSNPELAGSVLGFILSGLFLLFIFANISGLIQKMYGKNKAWDKLAIIAAFLLFFILHGWSYIKTALFY